MQRILYGLVAFIFWTCQAWASQSVQPLVGEWFDTNRAIPQAELSTIDFHYRYRVPVTLTAQHPQVLVFTDGLFFEQAEVLLYVEDDLVFSRTTGHHDSAGFDFFMRNDIKLPAIDAEATLEVRYASRFVGVQPGLSLWPEALYQERYHIPMILTVFCLGILVALVLLFGVLTLGNFEHSLLFYSLFVLLCSLYFADLFLVNDHLLGVNWFSLAFAPSLLAGLAHQLFIRTLLQVKRHTDPALWWLSQVIFGLTLLGGVVMLFNSSYANVLNIIGLLLLYVLSFSTSVRRSLQGDRIGQLYLLIFLCYVGFGMAGPFGASRFSHLLVQGEHLALVGLTLEAVLLGTVLAYKVQLIEKQRVAALASTHDALQLARTDALTGVGNRFALQTDLERQPTGAALAILDLDGLKMYNDTYGHDKGDVYLKLFADTLKLQLDKRAKVYRYGGDEFVALSHCLTAEQLQAEIAASIKQVRATSFPQAGASIGVATRQHGQPIREWIALADQRMYTEKQQVYKGQVDRQVLFG